MAEVGQIGEDYLKWMCTKAGLIANPSHIDRTGWDFLVEFPDSVSNEPLLTGHLHNGAPMCKIQVKSSFSELPYSKAYLSNLHRMATDPLPAFLFLGEYNEDGDPVRTHLIHIDSELIAKILERIRQLDIEEPDRKLNLKPMRLRLQDDSSIPNLTAKAFRKKLESYFMPNFHVYLAEKRRHLETIGFEDGHGDISFDFDINANNSEPSIVDVSIGLAQRARIRNFKYFPKRFNLSDSEPEHAEEDGWVELPNLQPMDAVLSFNSNPLATPIGFPVDVYYSPLNNHLPKLERRVRVKGAFFEYVLNPAIAGSCSFNFDLSLCSSISDLAKGLRFLTAVKECRTVPELVLQLDETRKTTIRLANVDQLPDVSELLKSVGAAERILQEFYVSTMCKPDIDDINRSATDLQILSNVLRNQSNQIQAKIQKYEDDLNDKRPYTIVSTVSAGIGDRLYVAIIQVTGPLETDEDGTKVSGSGTVLGKLHLDRNSIDWSLLITEIESLVSELQDRFKVYVVDLEKMQELAKI